MHLWFCCRFVIVLFYYYTNELSYLQLISFIASLRIIPGFRAVIAVSIKPFIPK